ncbi:MAG: flagellar basal-body MS-ring/collar protein FliF [Woeseiaceae bacterium]|nr:flagellar basal-body MS-ring/collar protein FliF [Woeseiaceae bacterium]
MESTPRPPSQLNLAGVLRIPAVRQVTLLVGVAAAIAAGFAIVLWSQTPAYTQLYGDLGGAEAAEVTDALRAAGIEFRVADGTGAILVPATRLHDARMQLASQGVPQSAAAGMGMLAEGASFGQSQFMESARYQHALETELARTIASLGPVRGARVHLALPKQTAFLRDEKRASASVLLRLVGGAGLEPDQSAAIVNLVASSVPHLAAKDVTLIDQFGRLLSSGEVETVDAQATSEFKYARRIEAIYKSRIEELLTPLVGAGRVRAQVVADVDFTVTEETRESFDPERSVIRSEQISEDIRQGDGAYAAGIPGALSNQPPQAEPAAEAAVPDVGAVLPPPVNTTRNSVRNYEVDRTISRTRPSVSSINRLSVAVLIDDRPLAGDAGSEYEPLTDAEIERYTALVRESVGFDAGRGDTVVVVNEAFRDLVPAGTGADAPPFWEKPLLRDIIKQVVGAIFGIALLFGIVRPLVRNLLAPGSADGAQFAGATQALAPAGMGSPAAAATPLPPPSYQEKVAAAKNISGHDPARVAQVVKQWVSADG